MTSTALHIWPGSWDLPSIDPSCLAAVLYLQISSRGQYRIVECTSSESSPTGSLPYLAHNAATPASLSALLRYNAVTGEYGAGLNGSLTAAERAQSTAWCTHTEAKLGDLVAHMLFAQEANWRNLTYPALVEMHPIPHRYYAPRRLRESYRARLEAAELWVTIGEEVATKESSFRPTERKKEDHHDQFLRVFEREKVMEKARSILEIYSRMLSYKSYFYGDQITTLDIIVAAHVLLMARPPYQDPLCQDVLKSAFPSLVQHAERVYTEAFPEGHSEVPTSQQPFSLLSLLPRIL